MPAAGVLERDEARADGGELRRLLSPAGDMPRHQVCAAMGHVWTAPAVQEESDYLRSVRVRSCIRPLSAAVWPLALM